MHRPSVLLAALALAAGAAAAQPALPADVRGGQAGVDVEAYSFALTLSDATDRIEVEAGVAVRFTSDTVTVLPLNLVAARPDGRGMTVASVTEAPGSESGAGGRPLAFSHTGDRLAIRVGPTRAGTRREYVVTYAGTPADGLIIGANRHGDRTFFGDNWPNRARHWLPTVDHPSDKARVEWIVTAPDGYQVVANGRLVEETEVAGSGQRAETPPSPAATAPRERGAGGRLTRYVSEHPLPTKIMVIGVAPFAVEHRGIVAGVPVASWAYAPDRDAGFADLALGDRVMRVFAERLGEFPYEKLAHVQSTTRYGGMENAGAIFYDEGAITGTGRMEGLIAHETAHQWFGNAVTETDWPHIWLSEGFATYLAHVYTEAVYGRDRMNAGLARDRDRVLAFAAENPALPVLDTITVDPNDLLNANSYQKGSWILHMLRTRVGDADFFDGLRTHYLRYRDGNASTDDFRHTMEDVSGEDLRGFFDQWLRRGGAPAIESSWRFAAQGSSPGQAGAVELTVRQTHAGRPFALPLDVALVSTDGTRTVSTVELTDSVHTFSLPSATAPAAVLLDPDVRLLASLTLTAGE